MAWFLKALRLWPWLAAISSGLLYAFCFAPFNQAWLCWIALTPLLAAIWFSGADSKRRWLRNLLLGYVSGVVFFSVVFSWLGSLGSLFQSVPLYGLPVLLSVYLGLYPAFWSWLAGLIRPREAVTAETGQQPAGKWDEMLMRAGQMPPPLDSPWLKSFTNLRLAFCLACVWVALGMDPRMAPGRLRLERPGHRPAFQLADHSDRRVYRRKWFVLCRCLRQCHRRLHGAAVDS